MESWGSEKRHVLALSLVLALVAVPVMGVEEGSPPPSSGTGTKTSPALKPDIHAPLPVKKAFSTSFVPIPEIITDPNEGNTFGILGVLLLLDEQDQIRYMIAPDVRYNDTKGVFPTLRLFAYPTDTRAYSITVGKSSTKDEDYTGEFVERSLWEDRAFIHAYAEYGRDSTERFYGFGNNSPESGESNYTSSDFIAEATPGIWLLPAFNVSYRMRIRRFGVQQGQINSLPFIADAHPEVAGRGLDAGLYWAHALAFTYDTRDSIDIPHQGTLATVYTEVADRHLGSSTSFVKFGLEALRFQPILKGNPVLAGRFQLDYTSGESDTPFWEMFSLGGHSSLRGFGSGRFYDFNRALATIEARTLVWEHRLFGVHMELEVAPFLETGQVFTGITQSIVNDLHWVYGVGFRGIARPRVVGYVDIGRSSEGVAIFTGINYPF